MFQVPVSGYLISGFGQYPRDAGRHSPEIILAHVMSPDHFDDVPEGQPEPSEPDFGFRVWC